MAHYKARVTYKNPLWKDAEENGDLEYYLTFDIVIQPPPQTLDIIQEHSFALQTIPLFWGGKIPLQPEKEKFIHPGRIVSVEILEHIEVAQVNPNAVAIAVAKR